MKIIRILIVDQDPVWIKKIVNYINEEDGFFVAATTYSKIEAIQLVQTMNFDVVLIDINFGPSKKDGIFTIAEMLLHQNLKIIALSNCVNEDLVVKSFTAGAVYYLRKNHLNNLITAIRSAYSGKTPLEMLLKEYMRLKKEEQLKLLTPAEQEIFNLLEQGLTQSQIVQRLHKTESTLKNQVNKILKKLKVNNSKDAVRKVQTRGLL